MSCDLCYCRLCAKPQLKYDIIDISVDSETRHEIIEKLAIFSSNPVDFTDLSLPETICMICCDILRRSSEFLAQIQESQDVLCKLESVRKIRELQSSCPLTLTSEEEKPKIAEINILDSINTEYDIKIEEPSSNCNTDPLTESSSDNINIDEFKSSAIHCKNEELLEPHEELQQCDATNDVPVCKKRKKHSESSAKNSKNKKILESCDKLQKSDATSDVPVRKKRKRTRESLAKNSKNEEILESCEELESDDTKDVPLRIQRNKMRAKIINLWKQKISVHGIARRLVVSRNTVRKWIRRFKESGDITARSTGPRPITYTEECSLHREIVQIHTVCPLTTTRATAAANGISMSTVRKHLHAAGMHDYHAERLSLLPKRGRRGRTKHSATHPKDEATMANDTHQCTACGKLFGSLKQLGQHICTDNFPKRQRKAQTRTY